MCKGICSTNRGTKSGEQEENSFGQTGCAAGKQQRVPFAGVLWESVGCSCFPHGEACWGGAGCILRPCTNTKHIVEYRNPVLFMDAAHW